MSAADSSTTGCVRSRLDRSHASFVMEDSGWWGGAKASTVELDIVLLASSTGKLHVRGLLRVRATELGLMARASRVS